MADIADIAGGLDEITYAANLHNSRRDEPAAVAIGECLYCGEAVEPGRRWCDFDCMAGWEAEQ